MRVYLLPAPDVSQPGRGTVMNLVRRHMPMTMEYLTSRPYSQFTLAPPGTMKWALSTRLKHAGRHSIQPSKRLSLFRQCRKPLVVTQL